MQFLLRIVATAQADEVAITLQYPLQSPKSMLSIPMSILFEYRQYRQFLPRVIDQKCRYLLILTTRSFLKKYFFYSVKR